MTSTAAHSWRSKAGWRLPQTSPMLTANWSRRRGVGNLLALETPISGWLRFLLRMPRAASMVFTTLLQQRPVVQKSGYNIQLFSSSTISALLPRARQSAMGFFTLHSTNFGLLVSSGGLIRILQQGRMEASGFW